MHFLKERPGHYAALEGVSLKQFFMGGRHAAPIGILTPEQIEDAVPAWTARRLIDELPGDERLDFCRGA